MYEGVMLRRTASATEHINERINASDTKTTSRKTAPFVSALYERATSSVPAANAATPIWNTVKTTTQK
jgi:hypothetical protein